MRFEIITYDVWGNTRDGYTVNQSFHTGWHIDVDAGTSDRAINRRIGVRGVTWEGELEHGLYGTIKRNGKPALELRPLPDENTTTDKTEPLL